MASTKAVYYSFRGKIYGVQNIGPIPDGNFEDLRPAFTEFPTSIDPCEGVGLFSKAELRNVQYKLYAKLHAEGPAPVRALLHMLGILQICRSTRMAKASCLVQDFASYCF
jgi:hypothetical protein